MKTKLFVVLALASLFLATAFSPVLATIRVSILCATESGNCVESWNGSDIIAYSDVGSTQVWLMDGATGDTTIATGDMTITDGDLTVGDDLKISAQTSITVTDAATFTVTGTYQAIASSVEVTPTIAAGAAGDTVWLINSGSNTINIADSGIVKLAGALQMGQNDTILLFSDGTNWIELSRSDN